MQEHRQLQDNKAPIFTTKQEQQTVSNQQQQPPELEEQRRQEEIGRQELLDSVTKEEPKAFSKWKQKAVMDEADAMDEQERVLVGKSLRQQRKQFEDLSGKDQRYTAKQREAQYMESLGYYTAANEIKQRMQVKVTTPGQTAGELAQLNEDYLREISKAKLKYIKATSETEDGETFLTESEEIRCLQSIIEAYRSKGDKLDAAWLEQKLAPIEQELRDKIQQLRQDKARINQKEKENWDAETALYRSKLELIKAGDGSSILTNLVSLSDQLFQDGEKHSKNFETFRKSFNKAKDFMQKLQAKDKTGTVTPKDQTELALLLEEAENAGFLYLEPKNRSHKNEEYRKRYDNVAAILEIVHNGCEALNMADEKRTYMLDEILDPTLVNAPVMKTWETPKGVEDQETAEKKK